MLLITSYYLVNIWRIFRNIPPARISFKYEGEIKSFSDKQKLREFCTTKPALQQILKDIL